MPKTCTLIVFSETVKSETLLPVIQCAHDVQTMLDEFVKGGADYILMTDCRHIDDLQRYDMALSVAEARAGRDSDVVRIIASLDSAAGLMLLPLLAAKSNRLAGLTWNRKAFCADLGCGPESDMAGHARMQVAMGSRAIGLPAYDSVEFGEDATTLGFHGYCFCPE